MKFSTLIVNIVEVTDDLVTYTSKTDVSPREYKHIIPWSSNFPFERLLVGHWYALMSAKPDNTWFWFLAYPLSNDSNSALIDDLFYKSFLNNS